MSWLNLFLLPCFTIVVLLLFHHLGKFGIVSQPQLFHSPSRLRSSSLSVLPHWMHLFIKQSCRIVPGYYLPVSSPAPGQVCWNLEFHQDSCVGIWNITNTRWLESGTAQLLWYNFELHQHSCAGIWNCTKTRFAGTWNCTWTWVLESETSPRFASGYKELHLDLYAGIWNCTCTVFCNSTSASVPVSETALVLVYRILEQHQS